MGCGTAMVKYILFFFNFLFVIGGILLITAGALSYTGYDKYLEIAKEADLDVYKAPPILMMVVGSIIFLIAFLGCCGTMRESNCMMMTYGFVLTLILIVEIAIVIVAVAYQDKFEEGLQNGLTESMKKYSASDDPLTEGWNSMQKNLHCCGVEGYKDWANTAWNPVQANLVPQACCKEVSDGCSNGVVNQSPEFAAETIYIEGCFKKAMDDIKDGIHYLTIAGAVVGGVELLGIIFACCLAGRFRRKHYAV